MKKFICLMAFSILAFTQIASAQPNFTELDKNQDGQISREEASDRLAKHFDTIDTDSDGYVTKEELKEMKKKSRGRKQ